MTINNKNIALIFGGFLLLFSVYNIFVYTQQSVYEPVRLSSQALYGQKLWQENNCWSCHQIYGLGGYLGPDLTNVISAKGKGEIYVKAFLNSGVKTMPAFNFTEEQKNALIRYLTYIDSTGYYPNYNAKLKYTGWVTLQYKHED